MRRSQILVFLLLALCGLGNAQSVSVSGTITDTDGVNWNNGLWSAMLQSPNGPPMFNGVPVTVNTFYGMLDPSGVMTSSGQFFNTGTITPTGAFYEVNMCSATTAPCSRFNIQVSDGASVISAINASIVAPRFPAFIGSLGYSDVELIPTPIVGGRYFNSNLDVFRFWDGSAWQTEGTGGSPYDPTNVAITGGSISNVTMTGATIDNSIIGNTTPSIGYFTQLGTTNLLFNCTVGVGGITQNHLVAFATGTATCVNAGLGAVNVLGVAQLTKTAGNVVKVSEMGNFTCLAQGSWVIGDFLTPSISGVAGACTDTGQSQTALIPSSLQIVGRALANCVSGSTCSMNNEGPGHFGRLYPFAAATLVAVTPSIGGSLLTVGCTAFTTIVVASAATNMACIMSGVAGNPANIQPQCSVLSPGVVTPQLCSAVAVTPTAQVYNIRVIP